ncbi:pyridoxal phosphate-dependent aminotransferase [methanotrophic endosymbiont of Bathymodiolus puteoserpentis (Logatchev)]|jgi:aspartate/methionine/tyrosine aminotransferase|uniref:pyridoxal phosphate-dependent aminotransferase n=1 Tax=methanotrophic endosymbiont of Bathymodiolus puteoserpentis (Logatchev) TaxID=343235 RepID=UPI00157A9EE8|nr:pyridoxal phosphate-dependent aminotransferase [methanotrophic endosymbiont of Bathymodiolus puteoserpentis (Logatchev)]
MQVAKRMEAITPFYVMELLRRAKQLEAQGRDIIHMEIGEPNFATPELITQAGIDYLKKGYVNYTPAAGLPELRQKISDFYKQKYQVTVPIERIFITPGASGAFLLAMGVSINQGDEIILSDPCYPCNQNFIRLFSDHVKKVPVYADTAYQLSVDLLRQHWQAQTRGVLIASPSNPTGTIIQANELAKAIEFVNVKQGLFFSDEIYHGLVYEQGVASALKFSDQVFVINSFSKYFGMTGWRIGWLIVPENFVQATEKLAQNIFISTSSHAQYAALAAFEPATLQELELRREGFAKKRDFLYKHLLRLGFKIPVKPAGAFYIYADVSQFTDNSQAFAEQLLEVAGVAITPGKDFGQNESQHYLRFSYTGSMATIAEGIERLERFINHL